MILDVSHVCKSPRLGWRDGVGSLDVIGEHVAQDDVARGDGALAEGVVAFAVPSAACGDGARPARMAACIVVAEPADPVAFPAGFAQAPQ